MVEQALTLTVQITQTNGLEPVGHDPKQQVARQVSGCRSPENCVPTTQSLSNRSPAGAIWRILCDQMSLNCRRTPRKDWQSAAKGAVLLEIAGA